MQSKLKPGAGCSTNSVLSCGGCSLVVAAFLTIVFLPHEISEAIFTWGPITVIGGGYTSYAIYLSIQQKAEQKRKKVEQKQKEAKGLKPNENMPYSDWQDPEHH